MKLRSIMEYLNRLRDERDMEVIRLYNEDDMTLKDIAKEAGMERSSIARLLQRYGVSLYRRGRPSNA